MSVSIEQEIINRMAQVRKSDCLTMKEAEEELRCSRSSLYNYMNALNIQRVKFPFDPHAYVLKSDIQRIREHFDIAQEQ